MAGPQQLEVVPQQEAREGRATSALDMPAGDVAGAITVTEGSVDAPEAFASATAATLPLRSL